MRKRKPEPPVTPARPSAQPHTDTVRFLHRAMVDAAQAEGAHMVQVEVCDPFTGEVVDEFSYPRGMPYSAALMWRLSAYACTMRDTQIEVRRVFRSLHAKVAFFRFLNYGTVAIVFGLGVAVGMMLALLWR